jgi:UDP-glucuronate 4-epimerase
MAVLVTGGAGFIGSHLLDRLVQRGDDVVCLDNFDDYYAPEAKRANLASAVAGGRVELVEGDIRDADLCMDVVGRADVGAVVHLAARAGVPASLERPQLCEQVNCGGTVNLLEAARRSGRVGRFVFASSSSVYGVNSKVPFAEDDPVPRPVSPYAATKRAGELLCHVYHHLYGLSIVCLRFFTVYGPRQRPDLAIHRFARLIEEGRPIPVCGDGDASRDYTYVSDTVDGIVAALDAPRERIGFEVINLGNGSPVRLGELVNLMQEALGREAVVERRPPRPGDVPVTWADLSRARALLGYEPRVPIRQGLARFVEWLRRQGSPPTRTESPTPG